MDKIIVKFEIKPIKSEYFECNLIGYNADDIGLYSGGFTSYESALIKIKEILDDNVNKYGMQRFISELDNEKLNKVLNT